jgi:glycosyltransferase involved in cell wall biosynthesis
MAAELAARGTDIHQLIVADDDNLDIAQQLGCETLERPNDSIGRRFNDGIQHALEHGADWIVYVGSDDWIHPSLLADLPNDTIVTGRKLTIVNLIDGRAQPLRIRSRAGVIPWIIPASLLRACGGRPISERLKRGLDGSLIRRLGKPTFVFRDPVAHARVDFKSRTNITPYRGLAKHLADGPPVDPWAALTASYPTDLVTLARDTHDQLKQEDTA